MKRLCSYIKHYAANVAGIIYVVCDVSLLLLGLESSLGHQIAGGMVFVASGLVLGRYGHLNLGFAASCVLSIVAMMFAVMPELHKNYASATAIGLYVYTIGNIFGTFSAPLIYKFALAPNLLVRRILGQPRLILSAGCLLSRAPMLLDAFAAKQWGWGIILSMATISDILLGISKPERERVIHKI